MNYLIVCGDSVSSSFATTQSLTLCGSFFPTADARTRTIIRSAITFDLLYFRLTANLSGTDSTARFRTGGANGNQVATAAAGLTGGFQDTLNTDICAATNSVNTYLAAGDTGFTPTLVSYRMTTTSLLQIANRQAAIPTSVSGFSTIIGRLNTNNTETRSQYTFRVASTLANLYTYIQANTSSVAMILKTRKNGANGAQSVSITAATAGAFEDTLNSDSIAVGDTVNYHWLGGGGTGNTSPNQVAVRISASNGRQVGSGNPGTTTLAFGTTVYLPLEGNTQVTTATEVDVEVLASFAFDCQNMFVNVPTNSVDGASTFYLRSDAGPSGLSVSVPDSTTGTFENTSTIFRAAATNLLDWQIVTGGAGGTMQVTIVAFELAAPTTAPSAFVLKMVRMQPWLRRSRIYKSLALKAG